ncbi:MAG: CDP-diacylglycerol--glycerol-3-phosphate 3-phosphatidyltransferase [Pirellula sp.]
MTDLTNPPSSNWNVPNALSSARLALAILVCVLIEWNWILVALVCFVVAASTDWVDGWWARKYNQVTKLGRILDPFVDKIIICGTMIALCATPLSPIAPWMATLVVGRELLVTSLRGMVEGQGGDFSAKQLGKWKMVAQCAALVSVMIQLLYQSAPTWIQWTSFSLIWIAIGLTVVSGAEYVMLVLRKAP